MALPARAAVHFRRHGGHGVRQSVFENADRRLHPAVYRRGRRGRFRPVAGDAGKDGRHFPFRCAVRFCAEPDPRLCFAGDDARPSRSAVPPYGEPAPALFRHTRVRRHHERLHQRRRHAAPDDQPEHAAACQRRGDDCQRVLLDARAQPAADGADGGDGLCDACRHARADRALGRVLCGAAAQPRRGKRLY